MPDEPQQAGASVIADISDAVRSKVTNEMRGAPMKDLITSDEDSESRDEATPSPVKKALESGKIRTTDSSVLHKVIWPHEVYTVMGNSSE